MHLAPPNPDGPSEFHPRHDISAAPESTSGIPQAQEGSNGNAWQLMT